MKKNRILSIVIMLILVMSTGITPVNASDGNREGVRILESLYSEQKELEDSVGEQEELQSRLLDLYQEVEREMSGDPEWSIVRRSDEKASNNQLIYNDNYGGSYISDNKLIVCVTDEAEVDRIESEMIKYRIVKHSYNELNACQSRISSDYQELYDFYKETKGKEIQLLDSLSGFGIDIERNLVNVSIVEYTEEKERLFKSLFGDYGCVKVKGAESKGVDCTAYKPGEFIKAITNRTGTTVTFKEAGIGFRAYRTTMSGATKYGFTSCGHGIRESIDGYVYSGGDSIIGFIDFWQYSGSVDASFVELLSANSITMTTCYPSTGDNIDSYVYMSSVAQGSTVYKVGATTRKTSGKVLNTNYTFPINGVSFTNQTQTERFCQDGDSGGLVYMYYDGGYKPAGVVKGNGEAYIGGVLTPYSVYTKASEVVYSMAVLPY